MMLADTQSQIPHTNGLTSQKTHEFSAVAYDIVCERFALCLSAYCGGHARLVVYLAGPLRMTTRANKNLQLLCFRWPLAGVVIGLVAVQCLAATMDELKAHYSSDVQQIGEVLSVDHSTAIAIMRHYEWYAFCIPQVSLHAAFCRPSNLGQHALCIM